MMNVLILYDDLFFYLSTQKVVFRQIPLCCTLGVRWVTIMSIDVLNLNSMLYLYLYNNLIKVIDLRNILVFEEFVDIGNTFNVYIIM